MLPAAAKAKVDVEKRRSFAVARERAGGLGDIGAHRMLAGGVVLRALGRAPALLQNFALEMLVYQKWIDDWMRIHLGLTAAELPFGIANYTALRPDYEAGAGGSLKLFEPDAAVKATWALPEVDFAALLRQPKGESPVHAGRPRSTAQPDGASPGSHSPVTDSGHVASETTVIGSPKKSGGEDPQARSALVIGGGDIIHMGDPVVAGGFELVAEGNVVKWVKVENDQAPLSIVDERPATDGEVGENHDPLSTDDSQQSTDTSATHLVSAAVRSAPALRVVGKL